MKIKVIVLFVHKHQTNVMYVKKDGIQVIQNVFHVQKEIVKIVIHQQDIVMKQRVSMDIHLQMVFVPHVMQPIASIVIITRIQKVKLDVMFVKKDII